MKSFKTYLSESQKTYDFRVRIAGDVTAEQMTKMKAAMEAYSVKSVSTTKRLPIQESDIDFPSMKNCQVYLIDAVLKYPVNDAQLRSIIAERAGIPQANIFVVPKNMLTSAKFLEDCEIVCIKVPSLPKDKYCY